jgi:parallel beta-helix repeat protein
LKKRWPGYRKESMNVRRFVQEYLPGPDEGVQAVGIEPTYDGARRTGVFEPLTNHLKIVVGRLVAIMLALLIGLLVSSAAFGITVVNVNPGDDLDAKANAAPAGATIQVHGSEAGTALYVYSVNNPIELKAGQTLVGDVGTTTIRGPANVPHPRVGIKGVKGSSMTTMLRAKGDPIRIAWLDLNATYTQKAINGLDGGPNLQMDHVVVHGAAASGIGQYRGFVSDSEIYNNGTNPTKFDGTVAGVKCNYACEVSHSYVHNNPGNGIWCDVGCQAVSNQPNGFYVHGNVVGRNGRHGIFYENAPKPSINPGDPTVKGLIQNNIVYGNGKSGISVSDSPFGTVYSNTLGKTVAGVTDHNAGKDGIEMHSSNDPSRGRQHDALIRGNTMKGESIAGTGAGNEGCGDNGNVCTNNK